METRDKKCEDRIDSHLAGRIADLAEIRARMEDAQAESRWDDADDAQAEYDEFALCMDLKVTAIIQISTGGPGDQFEVDLERGPHGWERADTHVTYRFLDWFDGATRRTDDPVVLDYVDSMLERLSLDV
jgi:hypothetical protein